MKNGWLVYCLMITNPPTILYKYLSTRNGIEYVLEQGTIKWSNPFEFNDLFDNQYNLQIEEFREELLDELLDLFFAQNFSSIFFEGKDFALSGSDFAAALNAVRPHLTNVEIDYLKGGLKEGIANFRARFPQFNDEFKEIMRNNAIFCLTDSPGNEAMWSYYADDNEGIVVGFSAADEDSIFPLAQPVNYAESIPTLKYADIMEYLSDTRKIIEDQVREYKFTKSKAWSHEKEWRIVVDGGAGVRPFLPQELKEIYLGHKISALNREKVKQFVKIKYPWAELFQSIPKTNDFGFHFEKLNLS